MPDHYHCESNLIHLTIIVLVFKSSSGPNRSRLGRQLSWCVVWGLLELVGWSLLICHSGWRDACEPRWRVPGCWFDRIEQDNKTLQRIHVVIYSWNRRRGSQCPESCGDHQWPQHRFSMFPMLFSPPPTEAWHGVTPSEGVEEWQLSALVRSKGPSYLVSCQVVEVLYRRKSNTEFIDVQTSSCCHCKDHNICVHCAGGHLGETLPYCNLDGLLVVFFVSSSSSLHSARPGTSLAVYKARVCGLCWWFASLSPQLLSSLPGR